MPIPTQSKTASIKKSMMAMTRFRAIGSMDCWKVTLKFSTITGTILSYFSFLT